MTVDRAISRPMTATSLRKSITVPRQRWCLGPTYLREDVDRKAPARDGLPRRLMRHHPIKRWAQHRWRCSANAGLMPISQMDGSWLSWGSLGKHEQVHVESLATGCTLPRRSRPG
jgi:hypothetical protein